MSCPTEPPAEPKTPEATITLQAGKRSQIWIEWGGKLPDGTPRTFGPYSSWDEAKRHGFKETKE